MAAVRSSVSASLWIAAATLTAVGAAAAVHALGWQPAFLLTPAAAAIVLAALFWFRAAEGLAALLLLSLFALTVERWLRVDLRLLEEATTALFLVVGVRRYGIPNGRLHIGFREVALLLVAALGLVSSALNAVPATISLPALVLLFKAVAIFYIVSWLPLTLGDVLRVGRVIVAVAVVVTLLGFVEFVSPVAFQRAFALPPFTSVRGELTVIKSLFLHPAILAWFSVFAALFLYAQVIIRHRWWLLPIAFLLNVGTILAGRRTSVVGLAVALVVAILWQWPTAAARATRLRTMLAMAAGIVIVVVAFFSPLSNLAELTLDEYATPPQVVAQIFGPSPDPAAIAAVPPRTALYVASVAVARDHFPLGAGLGRFGSQMSRAEYSPLYARYGLTRIPGIARGDSGSVTDTFWPMVLAETGVIGLLAYAAFIVSLIALLWRIASRAASGPERAFALGVLLVMVESVIASLTAQTYAAPPIAYLVFATAGAAIAVDATNHLASDARAEGSGTGESGEDGGTGQTGQTGQTPPS
jgi:hypothetical protein